MKYVMCVSIAASLDQSQRVLWPAEPEEMEWRHLCPLSRVLAEHQQIIKERILTAR